MVAAMAKEMRDFSLPQLGRCFGGALLETTSTEPNARKLRKSERRSTPATNKAESPYTRSALKVHFGNSLKYKSDALLHDF